MDIDFTTSELANGDIKTQTEEKPESTASENDYTPAQTSPVSPVENNILKDKLDSIPQLPRKENDAPFPPPGSVQTLPAAKTKGKNGLIGAIVVVIVMAGAGYFFLGTSQGRSIIGLAPKDNVNLLTTPLTTDSNTGTPTFSDTVTNTLMTAERDSQRKQDLASIKMYIDQYYTKKNKYRVDPIIEKIGDTSSIIYQALIPNITSAIPDDPWANDYGYWYGYKSVDGSSYDLTARLEDATDPSGKQEDLYYIYRITLTGAPAAE